MSLVAPYVDGKLQTSTTSSDSLGRKSSNSVVDSDTFLTLLVAEMQNQDPLEPTSNTEWVSQYATFTQVQQISEMADSMDLVRANNLIGKEVVMKVTSSSTGETSYKRGVVDYVVVEEGKPLLVIDEAKYSLSDLDTVASKEYFNAYDKYTEFAKKVAALPSLKVVDKSYQNTVQNIMDLYNGMSDYDVTSKDLEGIVSQLRIIKGVECAIFMYETSTLQYKVSLRSCSYVDVSKVAEYFGGGGHKRAAGCTINGTFYDVVNNLSEQIEKQM